MPRRPRPADARRSERWLRIAVNEHTAALNEQSRLALNLSPDDEIEWLSPIAEDGYAEYYDEAFLDRLRVERVRVPLGKFWPASGPRWDGLARTTSGRLILIEAKAYVEEAVDYRSKAGPDSLKRIRAALAQAKTAYHASSDADWQQPFYQYANRLAHLYYLRRLNGLRAYLLFVCFADAPDVPNPSSKQEWEGAIRVIEKALGLGSHPFHRYVGHIVWSVPDMLSGPSA